MPIAVELMRRGPGSEEKVVLPIEGKIITCLVQGNAGHFFTTSGNYYIEGVFDGTRNMIVTKLEEE